MVELSGADLVTEPRRSQLEHRFVIPLVAMAGLVALSRLPISFAAEGSPAAGTITTVAGTGMAGFSGDGGPATSARLQLPGGITVDGNGNLFIADTGHNRVRMVTPAGTISTVAGTGQAGFAGDGGHATAAQLNAPFNPLVDNAGHLFF